MFGNKETIGRSRQITQSPPVRRNEERQTEPLRIGENNMEDTSFQKTITFSSSVDYCFLACQISYSSDTQCRWYILQMTTIFPVEVCNDGVRIVVWTMTISDLLVTNWIFGSFPTVHPRLVCCSDGKNNAGGGPTAATS
jgi:hypothetical protein